MKRKLFLFILLFGLFTSCDYVRTQKVESIGFVERNDYVRIYIKPDVSHTINYKIYNYGAIYYRFDDLTRDVDIDFIQLDKDVKIKNIKYSSENRIKSITIGDVKYISTETEN